MARERTGRSGWLRARSTGGGWRGTLVLLLAVVPLLLSLESPSVPSRPGAGSGVHATAPTSLTTAVDSLAILSFVASPAEVVKSNVTYLNVTTSGGTEPLSYTYSGLPYPCRSVDARSLVCHPVEVRSFEVTVTVTDANNSSASASLSLTVTSGFAGPPAIASLVVWPSSVRVGQVAQIWVNATSSSEPAFELSITYFGLPGGCATFNATPLQCLPLEPGNYSIGARVTDGFGQFAQATVSFTVVAGSPIQPAGSPGPMWLVPAAIGATVGVALVAAAAVLLRRHRRG